MKLLGSGCSQHHRHPPGESETQSSRAMSPAPSAARNGSEAADDHLSRGRNLCSLKNDPRPHRVLDRRVGGPMELQCIKQQPATRPMAMVEAPEEPDLIRQSYPNPDPNPKARPISHEQLVAEVKGIYAGLVMVESKCIEVDNAQSQQNDSASKLNSEEQWQALVALHRTLLHEHHDFFLASQHPSASPALRRLALKYAMPARMWRHSIHSCLKLLEYRPPATCHGQGLEHMLMFIYLAYSMMAPLYETVPAFEDTWIECLGDLARYRMAIKDDDPPDTDWTAVPRHWCSKASDEAPTTGRVHHRLVATVTLAQPNALQGGLYHYTRSLGAAAAFPFAAECTITRLLNPVVPAAPVANLAFSRAQYSDSSTTRHSQTSSPTSPPNGLVLDPCFGDIGDITGVGNDEAPCSPQGILACNQRRLPASSDDRRTIARHSRSLRIIPANLAPRPEKPANYHVRYTRPFRLYGSRGLLASCLPLSLVPLALGDPTVRYQVPRIARAALGAVGVGELFTYSVSFYTPEAPWPVSLALTMVGFGFFSASLLICLSRVLRRSEEKRQFVCWFCIWFFLMQKSEGTAASSWLDRMHFVGSLSALVSTLTVRVFSRGSAQEVAVQTGNSANDEENPADTSSPSPHSGGGSQGRPTDSTVGAVPMALLNAVLGL